MHAAMRLFFMGPRFFGGTVRPGVSFRVPSYRGSVPFGATDPTWDSVYVIEGAPGHIKVGFSNDPIARLANLQTASPFPLRLAFRIASPRAFDIEQEAHAILMAHQMEGEWFLIDKEMAIAAVFGAASRLGVILGGETIGRPRNWAMRMKLIEAEGRKPDIIAELFAKDAPRWWKYSFFLQLGILAFTAWQIIKIWS